MTASFASSIPVFIFTITCISIISGINRITQVLRILAEKHLLTNILIYSDIIDNDFGEFTQSAQISLVPLRTNEAILLENLSKDFENNEINYFITIFDCASILVAITSITQIGIVLRNKTSNTTQSRRMPQYVVIWPLENEFLTDWEIMENDNKEILSAFSASSQLYIIQYSSENAFANFTFYEFYSLPDYRHNFIRIVNEVPTENFGIIGLTRYDFRGAVIKATAPEKNLTQGEVVFKESTDSTEFQGGFGVDIFNSLKYSLNFNSIVIPTTYWASQYKNGSWYGMAKEIIDNTADISVAKTSILLNRAQDLGYLAPTHVLGVYAFFEQPEGNTVRNIFFGPFSTNLWYTTFITYIGIIIFILAIIFLKMKLLQYPSDFDDHFLIYDSPIWTIATFCQQGWYTAPLSISLRITFICGIFLGLVLYIAYSATLISLFSTKTIPIKSLHDLLHSHIHLAVDKNNRGAAALVVQTNSTDSHQQFSASATLLKERFGKSSNSNFVITQDGISMMLAGHTAFLTFKDSFYTTTRNTYKSITDATLCKKVSSVAVLDSKFMSGLFVAKNSPFKEFFNIKLTTMYTSGLMFRYVTDYEHTYSPICDTQFSSNLNFSVGENDVYSAYVLILCGIFGSLLLLLFEYLFYHWKCNRIRESSNFENNDVYHIDIKSLMR